MNRNPDIIVRRAGNIALIFSRSQCAQTWLDENVDPEAMRWGPRAIACEWRYLPDLLFGLEDAGFTVGTDDDLKEDDGAED